MALKSAPSTRSRRPKKSLGQHFLRDERVVAKIADALPLSSTGTVIEIGPGEGVLTRELATRAGRVVAIELDDRLAEMLAREFRDSNVEVVHADALDIDPAEVIPDDESYALGGNLPYNIAQPLLRHYLEAGHKPTTMVVMVQAEVADSIVAKPGGMNLLSVSVQLYGKPEILFHVPPSAFRPPPKVRSAVVRVDVAGDLRASVDDTGTFFDIVRAGFAGRRKQLRNSLANGLGLPPSTSEQLLRAAGIDPTLRAQALSLDQWANLSKEWLRIHE